MKGIALVQALYLGELQTPRALSPTQNFHHQPSLSVACSSRKLWARSGFDLDHHNSRVSLSLWCGTLSKALEKSRTIISTWEFSSRVSWSSWVREMSCVSQLCWDLKPCWQFERIEYLSKWSKIWETMICSITFSKMPTVRNARSLVTSRELPSGLQIWGKRPLNALFSVATMNADTDSASEESVKVIQERVAHGTLYVRLTCPTMDNRHNKLSQVPEF